MQRQRLVCRTGKGLTKADVSALLERHVNLEDIKLEQLAKHFPRQAWICLCHRMLRALLLSFSSSISSASGTQDLGTRKCRWSEHVHLHVFA